MRYNRCKVNYFTLLRINTKRGRGAGGQEYGDRPAVRFLRRHADRQTARCGELYYNDDLSLSEIAENEGITRQGVRDSIKRAEAQLLEMEDRLGLARRFRGMREGLEAIRAAAEEIRELNDRYGYSREIHDRSGRILELSSRLAAEG